MAIFQFRCSHWERSAREDFLLLTVFIGRDLETCFWVPLLDHLSSVKGAHCLDEDLNPSTRRPAAETLRQRRPYHPANAAAHRALLSVCCPSAPGEKVGHSSDPLPPFFSIFSNLHTPHPIPTPLMLFVLQTTFPIPRIFLQKNHKQSTRRFFSPFPPSR